MHMHHLMSSGLYVQQNDVVDSGVTWVGVTWYVGEGDDGSRQNKGRREMTMDGKVSGLLVFPAQSPGPPS